MNKATVRKDILTRALAIRLLFFLLSAICLMSQTTSVAWSGTNDKPIARIDGTYNVQLGQTVYLNGNLSSDPNGDALRYKWTLVSAPEGSSAPLGVIEEDAAFSVYPRVVGKYVIQLIVNDGYEDSNPAYATITVYEKH